MSRELFNRNADLKRLRDDGYFVQVIGGFLVSALGGSRWQIGGPAGAFIVLADQ